jgi:hypothetical protein
MAFTDPLALTDSGGNTDNFVLQQRFAGGSDYVLSTSTPQDKSSVSFRHSNAGVSIAGKAAPPIRRHLVQFKREKYNSTLGRTEVLTYNVTITNDPASSFTTTDVDDMRAYVESFLSATTVPQLLRDET